MTFTHFPVTWALTRTRRVTRRPTARRHSGRGHGTRVPRGALDRRRPRARRVHSGATLSLPEPRSWLRLPPASSSLSLESDWLGGSVSLVTQTPTPSHTRGRMISRAELAQHGSSSQNPWVALLGTVFDVSSFLSVHPGGRSPSRPPTLPPPYSFSLIRPLTHPTGRKILADACGSDATAAFAAIHSAETLTKMAAQLTVVGDLDGGGGTLPGVHAQLFPPQPAPYTPEKSLGAQAKAVWLLRRGLPMRRARAAAAMRRWKCTCTCPMRLRL